jgi:myo-inositol catabolism protein IolC
MPRGYDRPLYILPFDHRGFAVGRIDFWDSLVAWWSGKASRGRGVAEIARRYREFAELFERRRSSRPRSAA